MKDIKTTNTLLLIIAIPLVFYILKILSFIFIPLFLSMFIVLLFLPLMRWMKKKGVPRILNILVIILIIAGILKGGGELIKLTSNEIITADNKLFAKAESKLVEFIVQLEEFFGIQRVEGKNVILHYLQKSKIFTDFGSTIDFIGNTLSMTLMTVFFAVLWLGESVNFQKLLNHTILKQKYSSVKVFMRIENDLIKFIIVKFFISLFTGAGFTVACLIFGVSFPIFWGLLAFFLNFIQMLGSVIAVILLSVFALVELDQTATLLLFIIIITGVQVVMGSVLEPVFMGKSFSINVITILIMLMFWGYLWGIPGLILAIPITVFLKIIFEQFPGTRIIAILMSGTDKKLVLPGSKKSRNTG
ncbi:MAG: AI-2E family transporter [Prolixibacteraceae bacterium]